MKKLLAVACASLLGLAGFGAVTWQVDCKVGNDAQAASDTTHATPFETIQAAVDAASEGDTINIAEGVYDKGGRIESVTGGGCTNRVVIAKNLTLVGAGREKTVILGKKGTGTYAPLGYDAVRCVLISNGVNGVTIKNLTLRGGTTTPTISGDSDGLSRRGGGICCGTDGNWLVDCTVEDCTAVASGAGYLFRAARTLFRNNFVRSGSAGMMAGAISYSDSRFLHCVFIGNGGAGLFYSTRSVFNCTFAANANQVCAGSYSGDPGFNNCVFDCDANPSSYANTKFNNCVFEFPPTQSKQLQNCVMDAPDYSLCAAPALNDVRPLAGCAAIGAGSYAILKNLTWGGDYRFTDFNGNLITQPADDKISAGACQTAVTPIGGLNLFVARDWIDFKVDGILTRGNKYSDVQTITNYFRTLTYPSQHLYKANCSKAGTEIRYVRAYFNGADTRGYYLPINADNECWALAAPAACTNLYYPSKTGEAWIDRNTTAESRDGSETKPFKSFKEALEAKLTADYNSCVFKVKPGVYDNDTATPHADYKCRIPVRKSCEARFIAVEGPEKTIVCGGSDPGSEDGCGANAVRICGSAGTTSQYGSGFLHGFTLTGGRTTVGGDATAVNNQSRGAVVSGSISDSSSFNHWLFTDCIISNNVAGASVMNGGLCARCLFVDNRSVGASLTDNESVVIRSSYITACVFTDNAAKGVLVGQDCHLVQCTVDEPTLPYGYKCNSYNTIASAASCPYVYGWFGCVVDGFSSSSGTKTLRGDPQFVDAANGDLRVFLTSPAVGFGQTDPATAGGATGRYVRLACGDADGNPLVFLSDGTSIAGAYQKTVVAVEGVATGGRGISPMGPQIPDADGRVIFTATESGTRNFLGFALNDVLVQPASEGTVYTYQVPEPPPTATPVVTAVYSTNWYANAAAPDDSASGVDADHPKRTLSAALRNAIAGDVVHAAEGTYDEGFDVYGVDKAHDKNVTAVTLRTRAVVPEGVTLLADGPQATTVIAGAAATHDADALGNGPDAIRCVHLSTNSCVRGFTISNGHTATNENTNANLDDRTAGGVICQRATSTARIEDCVITNCTAIRDVAGFGGMWYRCVIVDNAITDDNNGIVRNAYLRGCLCAKNRGTPVVYYGNSTQGTTFAPDNVRADGKGASRLIATCYDRNIKNCLFASSNVCNNDSVYTFTGCAFPASGNQRTANEKNTLNSCIEDDAVAILDERGAPKPLENPAVDAGDATLWTYGDTDARGDARVSNGAIDVGAVEADWRGVYAKFLRKSRLTVEAASSDVKATVVEGAVTGVVLPAGASLTLTIKPRGQTSVYRAPVVLASGATLSVSRNGGTAQTVTTSGEVELTVDAGEPTTFTFAATGGNVTLDHFLSMFGAVFLVR